MKIAFAYNLRTNDSEDQAEYDSSETVEYITDFLKTSGQIEQVELSRPLDEIVRQLASFEPDLVFNISEGTNGRFREAFWPAVYEDLGLLYTGSDPYTMTTTLDKNLTKKMVNDFGVLVPRGQLITHNSTLALKEMDYPLMIKPNFEGSSKGVFQSSIVETVDACQKKITELLAQYPDGVIVEEYIDGKDITVPILEALADPILDPMEYYIDPKINNIRKYQIYDYELKNNYYNYIDVIKADLPISVIEAVREAAKKVVCVMRCRDLGRMDFRVTPDGRVYFLEINCLPSLEKGASIYEAAKFRGLNGEQVIGAIITSAMMHRGVPVKS